MSRYDQIRSVETATRIVGRWLAERCGFSHSTYTLAEIARDTGVPLPLLGKLRRKFTRALAQSVTPGVDPVYRVEAQRLAGRAAITLTRINQK